MNNMILGINWIIALIASIKAPKRITAVQLIGSIFHLNKLFLQCFWFCLLFCYLWQVIVHYIAEFCPVWSEPSFSLGLILVAWHKIYLCFSLLSQCRIFCPLDWNCFQHFVVFSGTISCWRIDHSLKGTRLN